MKLPNFKTTLTNVVQKPSLKNVVAAALLVSPVTLAATVAYDNKDAIKSTLGHAAVVVKEKAEVIGDKVEKVAVAGVHMAEKGVKSVAGGMQNMMYMGMAAGAIVVLIMILK
jgi:hypothetical protein